MTQSVAKIMEHYLSENDRLKAKDSKNTSPQSDFFHHESYIDLSGIEPGPPQ